MSSGITDHYHPNPVLRSFLCIFFIIAPFDRFLIVSENCSRHQLYYIYSTMQMVQSPDSSSLGEFEDEAAISPQDGQWQQQNPSQALTTSAQAPKVSLPVQKRRRVTRACDECRRKKIKCDGKQPCTHCTVYSYGQSLHQYAEAESEQMR